MNNKKVSIIVPIYQVEKYLRRCVDSILSQTYENIEVILVDDGSKDNSGKICDTYQSEKVHVYHKKNGGLSDARNYGLKKATGEYICFVDSDDYISARFVERLVCIAEEKNVSLAAVGFQEFSEDMIRTRDCEKNQQDVTIYQGIDAITQLYSNETYCNYAWNKIYKHSLFEDVSYPIGKKMEDLGTTYKLIDKAGIVAYSTEKLYYYFQRDDSILHTLDDNFYQDKLEMAYARFNFIKEKYPELYINYQSMLNMLLTCYANVKETEWMQNYINDIIPKVKHYMLKMDMKTIIKYVLFKINRKAYRKLVKQRRGIC